MATDNPEPVALDAKGLEAAKEWRGHGTTEQIVRAYLASASVPHGVKVEPTHGYFSRGASKMLNNPDGDWVRRADFVALVSPQIPAGGVEPVAGAWCTLAECPIGLFRSGDGELCLKTEYGDNEGRIDAYIVSSGEFFWGGTNTRNEQRKVKVLPVLTTLASPPSPQADPVDGWRRAPVDPTEAMIDAADSVDWSNEDERATAINVWHAMLSAAPKPETSPETQQEVR